MTRHPKACKEPPWQPQLDALLRRRAAERQAARKPARKKPEFTPGDAVDRLEQIRQACVKASS